MRRRSCSASEAPSCLHVTGAYPERAVLVHDSLRRNADFDGLADVLVYELPDARPGVMADATNGAKADGAHADGAKVDGLGLRQERPAPRVLQAASLAILPPLSEKAALAPCAALLRRHEVVSTVVYGGRCLDLCWQFRRRMDGADSLARHHLS